MRSIQTKFITMIAASILSLGLILGGYATITANRVAINDSELVLNGMCNEQTLRMDAELQRIEQAVTIIYNYAQKEIPDIEKLADDEFCDKYVEKVKTLALDVAEITDGARTAYFRVNPEIASPLQGFFLVKPIADGEFFENEITDLYAYPRDDVKHVGWYYQPVDAGKPIWMSPYLNENIDLEIISYVIPFYEGDTLIGVVGIDVDFSQFVDLAQEANSYDGGHSNLIDINLKEIYFRSVNDGNVHEDSITDALWNVLCASDTNGDHLVDMPSVDHSIQYKIAFSTTRNGMKYMMLVDAREINRTRNQLILGIVLMTIGALAVFIIATTIMTRRIISPLRELAAATEKLAVGDWNVDIRCKTKDEVKVLSTGILAMADELRQYVSEVNSIAYRDGLTGVKNKTCYNDYIIMVEENVGGSGKEYAVVSFDVNNLKEVNDNYGHLAGDSLLTTACQYICKTFAHSPVFRTGGDEFVAILEGGDYNDRNELVEKFEKSMKSVRLPVEPFSPITIAFGMAEYPGDGSAYNEVFETADARMYEKKRAMKAAKGDKVRN